ncbi:MAG TPA: Crp/Fnr family transcriptional regulator [Solirubrobacteraceae bacterium]|nr:Crp/Fnr family transcriptional regulator [Solirubrobacteraceae bacterium]
MTDAGKTFLDSLSSGDRESLLTLGHRREWGSGGVVVRTGEPADSAIILLSGLVKIHRMATGGEEVLFAIAGAGDLLGEMSTIRDSPRSATVTALTSVAGVVLPAADLRSFFARHPHTVLALLDLALTRLHTADIQRLEFVASDSLGRVTSRLIELAERFGEDRDGGAIEVPLPLNQEELASWSGASRESTARALRALRQLELIRTHRLHLTVLDLDRLRNHAART